MEIIKVAPRIFFAKFQNRYKMVMATLRFNNSYDKKNEETFEHFCDRYDKKYGGGNFKTYQKSIAFSIPGCIFNSFIKSVPKEKWTEKEKELISGLELALEKEEMNMKSRFNVIACHYAEKSSSFKHELSHSLYDVNKRYKESVNQIFNDLIDKDMRYKIYDYLKNVREYELSSINDDDFIDEANAYIVSSNPNKSVFFKNLKISTKDKNKISKEFNILFKESFKSHEHGDKNG